MAEVTLTAEAGRTTGSSSSRRLRGSGRIPGIIYGHGMSPVSVSVNARDLRHALTVHGLNQVLTLDVSGSTHLVMARQLQRHPVRHTVAHVDFQVVRRDEIVQADVPVVVVGTALAVERDRGLIDHPLTSLSVHSTPEHIPTEITVDVSQLTVGDVIRVGDLKLPPGVTTDVDPDEVVVIAASSTVEAEVEAAETAGPETPTATAEAGAAAGEED
jgi:large subunit ribosomal protein L25